MKEKSYKIGILHYSTPPVIGGVESVIHAHANLFLEAGYSTTVIAGRGDKSSLPDGTELILIPEMDTKHPQILEMNSELEQGIFPQKFEAMTDRLTKSLTDHLSEMDMVIVHNVFTKHFNLPLTAALFRLLDRHAIRHCVAWCHDITWTSPHSRPKVHDGFPWDLLRTFRTEMTYVTISHDRQQDLAGLFGCPPETIRIIYNGVDQNDLLALSDFGRTLIDRLGLWDSDLNLLLPVRVTQAKNMELALHVVAALKKKKINVRLIVTGPPDPHDQKDIEYFQELLDLRKRLGVEEEMRFVYQSGEDPSQPLIVEMSVVSELFRVSDALFMPSHREGFGMPILEAGLVGIPIFCADTIPSAKEIAAQDAVMFPPDAGPEIVADMILDKMKDNPVYHFRQKVRKKSELAWNIPTRHAFINRKGQQVKIQNKEDLLKWALQAKYLWLFLDYDGTLADFAPTPDHIVPDPVVIQLLERLAKIPSVRVTVISGRRLKDIQTLVPVNGIYKAGTYGIELMQPNNEITYRVEYENIRPHLDTVKPQWERLTQNKNGFFLEDKGWTLALHARFANDTDAGDVIAKAKNIASIELPQDIFHILGGHKFLEIAPKLANKKDSVSYILEKFPLPEAELLYFGDDDKDENAFPVIHSHQGYAVKVIHPAQESKPTTADVILRSPAETIQWLGRFLQLKKQIDH